MTTIVLRSSDQTHVLAGPGTDEGVLRVSPVRAGAAMSFAAVRADGQPAGRSAGTGLAIPVSALAEAGSHGVELSVRPHGTDRFGAGESATFRAAMAGSTDEVLVEDLEVAGLSEAPVLRAVLDERRRVVVTRLGAPARPADGGGSPVHALARAVQRAQGDAPPTVPTLRLDTSASMLARRQVVEALCDAVAGLCGQSAPQTSVVAPPAAGDGSPWVGSAEQLLAHASPDGTLQSGPALLVTDLPPREMPPGTRAVVLVGDDVLQLFRADHGRVFGVGPGNQQRLLDAHDDDATRAFLHTLSGWLREARHQEGRDTR